MKRYSFRPAVLAAALVLLLVVPDVTLAAGGGISSAKIWDFVWRCLNFAVLFIGLYILLKKPIAQFFSGRVDNISQTFAEFEEKKAKAEATFKALEGKLANLEAERENILAEYVKAGEEEKAKIIAQAHITAERIKSMAQVTIAQEISQAKAQLMAEVAGMAAAMAEDLVKKHINDEDQDRLVEEYLTKVVQH